MQLFTADERRLAESIAALAFANPFLDERIAREREILGDGYIRSQPYWSLLPDLERKSNIERIAVLCEAFLQSLHARLRDGMRASRDELQLYDEIAIYVLYERYRDSILELITSGEPGARVAFYGAFKRDVDEHLAHRIDAAHLFACFYQVRRAFHHIFENIVGRTLPAARLRAAIWQSIFTHDMRRYRRSLYARMGDVATLITGPTGTGKELVARAIGLSRYLPFDERRERFSGEAFIGLNISALSPTLIESELFGHRKGSFTGAVADREGFLESCGAHGTVFLDEIGEIDSSVQVKLLRVIQSRTFQRLGDTQPRRFEGKLIAATNRDLAEEIRKGRFREDFYYRLCADSITTPALHEQLEADPGELQHLVRFISARVASDEEADELAGEVVRAIGVSPGRDYRWPGNFRELEQCVRSVMLRGDYRPASMPTT
ncbi:MAG TPA: sigma-54 factor interaction domain-containing protein, partial [Thermoanaerobaculia bacterium]|nr:sigma-54 factor interaction domain-containing protein [Thermoanaerobaculia bacterium]